ncbi:hypothetical protein ESZ53_08285 [Salinibacterium sp. UTAS2018]|uniref:hypothetical protein n=1 Tax=Salinibacterium sp. UTAS2018 TaxID=2508880 RepID=UPI0010097FB7|nr:hypothetical protein [Salinibacterium sp. UTAS2018]QAV70439.1 hypothetical protein ESZ53_08285 [Salinibacterium sp. UTAS2018]
MSPQRELLQVEIEEVEISGVVRMLNMLNTGILNQTLRFVGRVGGETRFKSGSFSSSHMFDPMNPDEAYAPRMAETLAKLRHEIEEDGWVETAKGEQSWALTFARAESA